MERFIEKIISILEKKTIIKNVFSVPKDSFKTEKFQKEVENIQRYKYHYISDIDSYIEYFEKHFPASEKFVNCLQILLIDFLHYAEGKIMTFDK